MAYISHDFELFRKVFPDRGQAIYKINKHLGRLSDRVDRSPFVEFEIYINHLKYWGIVLRYYYA